MALISQFLSYFYPSLIISPPCPSLFLARNHRRDIIRITKRIFVCLSKLRRILIFTNAKYIDIISGFLGYFTGWKIIMLRKRSKKQIYLSILIVNENNFSRLKNILEIIWNLKRFPFRENFIQDIIAIFVNCNISFKGYNKKKLFYF